MSRDEGWLEVTLISIGNQPHAHWMCTHSIQPEPQRSSQLTRIDETNDASFLRIYSNIVIPASTLSSSTISCNGKCCYSCSPCNVVPTMPWTVVVLRNTTIVISKVNHSSQTALTCILLLKIDNSNALIHFSENITNRIPTIPSSPPSLASSTLIVTPSAGICFNPLIFYCSVQAAIDAVPGTEYWMIAIILIGTCDVLIIYFLLWWAENNTASVTIHILAGTYTWVQWHSTLSQVVYI